MLKLLLPCFFAKLVEQLEKDCLLETEWFSLSSQLVLRVVSHLVRLQQEFILRRSANQTTDSRFWLALTEFAAVIMISSVEVIHSNPNGELVLDHYAPSKPSEQEPIFSDENHFSPLELNDPPTESTNFEADPEDFVFEADSDPEDKVLPTSFFSTCSADMKVSEPRYSITEKLQSLIAQWSMVDWFGAQIAVASEADFSVSPITWFVKMDMIAKLSRLASIPTLNALSHCLGLFGNFLSAFPDAGSI